MRQILICLSALPPGTLRDRLTQPEDGTLTLEPGMYEISAVLFDGTPPAWVSFSMTHLPPEE